MNVRTSARLPGDSAPLPSDPSMVTGCDRALHAQLAHLTQGISPASVISAYMDWLVHLAMSPGKRADLLSKAQR